VRGMHGTHPGAVRLVAGREISERIGSRALRITTAVMTLLVIAGVLIPSLVGGPAAPTRIGLLGARAQALAPALRMTARAAKVKLAVANVASEPSARAQLHRGSLDVVLSVTAHAARAEVEQSLSSTERALLGATVDAAHQQQVFAQAGVPRAVVRAAQTPPRLAALALSPPPAHEAARDVTAIAASLLLYLTLVIYGGALATGVAQEKTSRTAEVLLASVRPRQLLAGKIIGIGACGFAQLAIVVSAGLATNALAHSAEIPSTIWSLLPASLLWFVLGYGLYSFAYATAGAIVARQEEVQFATVPLSFPLLASYLLSYAAVGSPHATWLKVCSFLPPFAPSLMPARIALGTIAWWEVALGALVTLAAVYGMVRLATRVYSSAVMHSGPRLSWRAALALREPPHG